MSMTSTLLETCSDRPWARSVSRTFALLEEVELSDEALETAISAIEAEFHPRHAFITPAYIRPYGIEARLQVAIIRHEKESA